MSWWTWVLHVAWLAVLATWAVVAARPRNGSRETHYANGTRSRFEARG